MTKKPTTPHPGELPDQDTAPAEPDAQASPAAPSQSSQAPQGTTTRTVYRAPRRTVRIAVPDGWARALLSGVEAALMGWGLATLLALLTYWAVADNPWMAKTEWSHAMSAGATLWAAALGGDILIPADPETGSAALTLRATPLLFTVASVAILRVFLLAGRKFPPVAHFYAIPGFMGMSALLVAANHAWLGWGRFLAGAFLVSALAVVWAYVADRKRAAQGAESASSQRDRPDMAQVDLSAQGRFRTDYVPFLWRGIRWSARLLIAAFAGAILVLLVGVALRWQAVVGIGQVLMPASALDVTLMVIAQVLFIPNVAAWVLAWGSGAGMSVGGDALHSVAQATVAPIPPVPLLGVLPTQPLGMGWVALPVLVSAVAGIYWGRGTSRERSLADDALSVATMLVGAFAGFALWLSVSNMTLGSGRLAHVGSRPYLTAGALVVEIGLPLASAYLMAHPHFVYGVKMGIFRAHTAIAGSDIGVKLGIGAPALPPEKPQLGVVPEPVAEADTDTAPATEPSPAAEPSPAEGHSNAHGGTEASASTAEENEFPITGETPFGLVRLEAHETEKTPSNQDCDTETTGDDQPHKDSEVDHPGSDTQTDQPENEEENPRD